jgi:hypothetical protein
MRLELASQTNLAGGLNTQQSVFVPSEDAIIARNVDVTTGGVSKRQGTVRLVSEGVGQVAASHFFYTNSGIALLVYITGTTLRIYSVNTVTGALALVRQVANVFSVVPRNVNFVVIPGNTLAVVLFSSNQQPVQLNFLEFTANALNGSEVRFRDYYRFALNDIFGKPSNTFFFVNKLLVTGTLTRDSTNLWYALTSAAINASTFIDASLLLIVVSAWTEAVAWRGENFHTVVPRLHTTNSDATVEIPSEIKLDTLPVGRTAPYDFLRVDALPLGVADLEPSTALNYSSVVGNVLPLDLSQTLTYQRYAFSDGTYVNNETRYPYKSATLGEVAQGSDFITFGNTRKYIRYTLNTINNISNGAAIVPRHEFETGDVVSLPIARGNGLDTTSVVSSFRYVKKIDGNKFELYNDAALTSRDTTSLASQTVFNVNATSGQGAGQIVALGANVPTGTFLYYLGTTANNVGIPTGNYAVKNVGAAGGGFWNYEVYYDVAMQFRVQTMSAPSQGNGGMWAVQLEFQVERLTQDNVYISRARPLTFNGGAGALPANIGILRNSSFGSNFTDFVTNPSFDGRTAGYSMWFADSKVNMATLQTNVGTSLVRTFYIHTHATNNANDWQIVYNRQRKWIGSAFQGFNYPVDPASNTWVSTDLMLIPVAGFGQLANFDTGVFPYIAAVYNNRLVLTGMAGKRNELTFSALLNTDAPFAYPFIDLQVNKGADVSDASLPFDLLIDDEANSLVTALHVWQNQMFAFTADKAYQVSATNSLDRELRLLSGNGAVNSYCVCSSDRILYFASRNGVYAIPLTDSGEYRTGDISGKVYSALTKDIVNTTPFLLFNNDDAVVTLCAGNNVYRYNTRFDNWTLYDTVLGFNVSYASIMAKWLVMVCGNKLGTTLIREGGNAYADFVNVATPTVSTVVASTFSVPFTFKQAFYRVPWQMCCTLSHQDIRVWSVNGAVVTELTWLTQFRKINAFEVEILDTTLNVPTLVFAPRGDSGDWFGAVTLLNSVQQQVDYGVLNVASLNQTYTTNLTLTALNTLLVAAGVGIGSASVNDIANGYMYISEYQSGAISAELFDMYKRLESVSVLLQADVRRYYSTALVPQYAINQFFSVNAGAYVGVKVTASREELTDTFMELTSPTYADEYTLYRQRINLLGYMFYICCVSLNAHYFKLIAWNADIDMRSGTGQISGGR